MPLLSDLISLIPIALTALLGSLSQVFGTALRKSELGKKKDTRVIKLTRIFIGTIVSTVIVGLGGPALFPALDWKLLSLVSFVLGFMGERIAILLSTTTFGLKMLGQSAMADAIDLAEKELKKPEEKKEGEKNVEPSNNEGDH